MLAGLVVAGLAAAAIALALMFPTRADRVNAPLRIEPLTRPALRVHARLLERVTEVEGVAAASRDDFRRYPHQADPLALSVPIVLADHLRAVALGERYDVVGGPPKAADSSSYQGRYALWLPGGARAHVATDAPEGALLRLGLGRVAAVRGDARPPATVVLEQACGAAPRALVRWPVERWGWQDVEVAVPACADGTLTFRAEGPPDAHLLIAHPTLWRPAGERPPNVIVVNIDTLMPWALGLHGNDRGASPRLDALAREGVIFEHTFANGNWSKSSHASFWTSQLPGALGIRYWRSGNTPTELANWRRMRHRTLVHAFRDAGYNTFAAMSNVFASPFMPTGVDFGFERIQDDPRHMDHPLTLIDAIEDFLAREGDAPFFIFFNPETPHYKYRPPRDYLAQTGLRGPLDRDLYLGEVAYADAYLGRLLDILERAGLAGNTLVLVTSDHGEQLDDAHAFAISARDDAPYTYYLRETTRYRHGHSGFDEEIRVPWVMRLPGRAHAGTRIAAQVQVLDQAPTLLKLVGLPAEPSFRGRAYDPAGPIADSPVLMQGRNLDAVRADGLKYVRRRPGADLVGPEGGDGPWTWQPEALYDLREDPDELRDVAAERPADVARMRALWQALRPDPPELWTLRLPARDEPWVVDARGPVGPPLADRDDRAVVAQPGGWRVVLPAPVPRELSFAAPPEARFRLHVAGAPRLRGGALGLPFLEGPPVAIGPADAPSLLAVDDPGPAPEPVLWRRPLLDGGPESTSAAALGKDLEDALKAWGYAK